MTTATPADKFPPLPAMAEMASIQGHDGSEYRLLSTSYEPGFAMYSEVHMRDYATAHASALLSRAELAEQRIEALTREAHDWWSAANTAEQMVKELREALSYDAIYTLIRGTGYVTRGQADEITSSIAALAKGQQTGVQK